VDGDSDEALWRLLLAGDERRFGTIWDRHRDRVLRHLIAGGNSASAAEDLTAIAFMELWRRRGAVRFVDGSLLPWLIVTAHNVARNAQRARRRYEKFLAGLPGPSAEPDPADRIADRDDARLVALREAMAVARPTDARLLAMTSIEGFTIREAATVLGLSESAAKMRLTRIRARLRSAVSAHAIFEGGS
jgi:RNA polymerase sigma-70 factor (ECF subfamily)